MTRSFCWFKSALDGTTSLVPIPLRQSDLGTAETWVGLVQPEGGDGQRLVLLRRPRTDIRRGALPGIRYSVHRGIGPGRKSVVIGSLAAKAEFQRRLEDGRDGWLQARSG